MSRFINQLTGETMLETIHWNTSVDKMWNVYKSTEVNNIYLVNGEVDEEHDDVDGYTNWGWHHRDWFESKEYIISHQDKYWPKNIWVVDVKNNIIHMWTTEEKW